MSLNLPNCYDFEPKAALKSFLYKFFESQRKNLTLLKEFCHCGNKTRAQQKKDIGIFGKKRDSKARQLKLEHCIALNYS